MRNNIEFYPSDGSGGDGGMGAERMESWRDRKPVLIQDRRIFRLGMDLPGTGMKRLTETSRSPIAPLQRELFAGIAAAFDSEGCELMPWPPDEQAEKQGRRQSENAQIEHFMGLRAIDLGVFSEEQRRALTDIKIVDEDSFWRFVDAYNPASPQCWPSVMQFSREVDLHETAPATYANVLFRQVEPDDGIPESLEPKKIEAMNWIDSAHYGSWKVLQVFWAEQAGNPEVKTIIMGALEGSRPKFGNIGNTQAKGELPELAYEIGRRLKIFGSTREVFADLKKIEKSARPNYDTDTQEPIPLEVWEEMPAVKSMIKTGKFLGEKNLISGAVQLARLAYGRLPRMLKKTAEYSQQAESARCTWEPLIDQMVVSVTGTLGGSKTETGPEDFVGVRPGGKLGLLLRQVGSEKPPKPSVEAREFALPLYKMAEDTEGFSFRVRLNEDGSYTADENGDYNMWRITGVDHLHRDVKVDQLDRSQIIVLESDNLDAVGCGVDANEEKSEYAVRQAYKQGTEFFNEHGYWPAAAVFYVPNHGWNAIKFAREDEDGRIDSDLDRHFRDAIENGQLVYGTYAEGVTQV